MAAPQWQLISLPLGRGLAQGEDARLVTPGSVGEANNVVVDRAGRYTKRAGWGRLPRTDEDGVNVPSPDRVDVAGAELLQVDATNGELWSWGPGRGRWERVGSLPEFRVERRPLLRTVATLVSGGIVRFGASDQYELVHWFHENAGMGLAYDPWRQIRDSKTGALIARDSRVYYPARLTQPIALKAGDSAWLVYAGGDLRVARYSDSLAFSDFQLDSATIYDFDAVSILGRATVAYSPFGTTDLRVAQFDEDGSLYADATIAMPTSVGYLAMCAGRNGEVWVAARFFTLPAGTRDILIWRLDTNLSVVAGYPKTLETGLTSVEQMVVGLSPEGDCYVAWNGALAPSDPEDSLHVRAVFASSNTVSSWRKTSYRQWVACAMQATGEGLYLPVLADALSSTDPQTRHAALVRVDNSFNSESPSLASLLVDHLAARETYSQGHRWVKTEDGYRLAIVVRTRADAYGSDTNGLDVIEIEANGRRAARSLALAQQAPIWGLGGMWGYDGFGVRELGILQPPEIVFDPMTGLGTGSGPYFDAGDYVYIARFEIIDDRGAMHVSPWSKPVPVEIATAGTNDSILFRVRNTQLTEHGRSGSYRELTLAIYRTDVNGAAAGVIRYYRLTKYGIDALRINSAAESVSYVDTKIDPTDLGLGVWTTAGRLPPLAPPPPRDLLACKGRLWIVPANTSREVWFSQQILADEVPWFHPGLSVQLLDTEEQIEALASLDDRVVVFTKTRIYVIEGDGPLDTGVGSFVGPSLISSAFGCVERRSVISTSRGVYFQAACGLCLLDRGLSVQVVGDPVRDLTESGTLEGVTYDEAQARVIWHRRFGEGLSSLVLYDERHAIWTTADSSELDAIRGLTWDRGRSALILAYTFGVCQEGYGATPGYDGDPSDPTWFATTLATPWVRSGAPGSWMQAELVHLEGEVQGPSKTLVRWYRDYSATADGSAEIDSTTATRGDRVAYQVGAKSQTCSAVKITVVESAPAALGDDDDAPHGIRWWGLTLKAAVQPGEARVAPDQRKGVA